MRRAGSALVLALAALSAPVTVSAQVTPPPGSRPATDSTRVAPPEPARPELQGVHVSTRTRGTTVAVAVLVPAGSALDPVDGAGTAYMLAEVVAAGARRRLPAGTDLSVRVERDWTAFTLLSPPDAWRAALTALGGALFTDPLPEALLGPTRDALLARFTFEEGAPVREFQRELYGVLTATASLWARPPLGRSASVRALGAASLVAFRRSHWERGSARVAVVGPVEPIPARAAVAAAGLGGRPLPAAGRGGRRAWNDGSRVLLQRDVTNAWVGAMYPAPANTPRTVLEALAHRVDETLNPATPEPGIFAGSARVEDTPDGPVLLVEAAVFPEVVGSWEERILDLVDDLEDAPEPAFFGWQRRRFRSARLLEEAAPEVEALRVALDLLREGEARDLPAEIWTLTPKALADAADALGEPRVLLLGPDLPTGSR